MKIQDKLTSVKFNKGNMMLITLTNFVYWYRANKVQAKELFYIWGSMIMFLLGLYLFYMVSHTQYIQGNP